MSVDNFSKAKKSLLVAIRENNVDRVRDILTKCQSELSPNEEADSARNRILHRASRYGHPRVVKLLLEEFKASPNEVNKFGMTPLHHAAVAGNAEVVQILIQHGGDVNQGDQSGRRPLHWSAVYGFPDVTTILIQKGGAVSDCKDSEGFTPLHRVCQEKPNPGEQEEDPVAAKRKEDEKRSQVAQILLDHGANPNGREPKGLQTPLHLCAINGFAQTAKVLVSNSSTEVNSLNKIGMTPLMYACAEDQTSTVAELLKSSSIDLKPCDKIHNGWNALHKAILQDNVATVKLLVEAGADLNARDGIGRTPLVLADDHSKTEVLRYLKSLKIKNK